MQTCSFTVNQRHNEAYFKGQRWIYVCTYFLLSLSLSLSFLLAIGLTCYPTQHFVGRVANDKGYRKTKLTITSLSHEYKTSQYSKQHSNYCWQYAKSVQHARTEEGLNAVSCGAGDWRLAADSWHNRGRFLAIKEKRMRHNLQLLLLEIEFCRKKRN